MASTFLVLRNNDTSPQLYFHDGQNIDPTGLGALPGAVLETATGGRAVTKHNNRVFTLLDMVFVIHNNEVYVSTDEGATFTLDHTFTGGSITANANQTIGPVPVMVNGALKLVGFYFNSLNINIFEYDVALDSWTSFDSGVNASANTAGFTTPVVFNGLVYVRAGDVFIAYDPVSTGTVTLTNNGLINLGADQLIAWNGGLWLGPITDSGINSGMALLQGSTWDASTGGVNFSIGQGPATTSKAGVFIDPNTGNLIVMERSTTSFLVFRITPGLVVTDITGAVVGAGLAALGAVGNETRIWPHISRSPGGNYTVDIYAARGGDTTDPVERFTWVNDATNFTELGVVGGTGDMAFPYAIHGGDYNGFFAGEKRVVQTAQSANANGITITCEAFQDGGTTLSVRGHYDEVGADPNALTLAPMTISNPAGTGGLSVSGSNPGAQIDGVPANRTAITFDWDQVTDGFVTGDNFNFQLEAL